MLAQSVYSYLQELTGELCRSIVDYSIARRVLTDGLKAPRYTVHSESCLQTAKQGNAVDSIPIQIGSSDLRYASASYFILKYPSKQKFANASRQS